MDASDRSGFSKASNLSGPSVSGINLEETLRAYHNAALQTPEDPWSGSLADGEETLNTAELPSWEVHLQAQAEQVGRDCSGGAFLDEDDFLELLAEHDRQQMTGRGGEIAVAADFLPGTDGREFSSQDGSLREMQQRIHRNVLGAAEPLTMPRPLPAHTDRGIRRVQRILAPLTAEEQAAYVPWTPQLGAAALAAVDPTGLDDDELLNYIQAAERQSSWSMARQAAGINEFATRRPLVVSEDPSQSHPDRSRYAAAELMAMFAIGAGAAEHLIADAELLIQHLPETFAEYDQGLLDTRRIRAIIRGCENTPPQILPEFEGKFLNGALSINPNALTRKVRSLAERHNPEPLEKRHERARTRRDVWLNPLPDGMAELGARLPATEATLLFNSLDDWARAAKLAGEDSHGTTATGRPSRSLNEYRADVLLDLLHETLMHNRGAGPDQTGKAHAGNGEAQPRFKSRIPAVLNVSVSADRLLGKSADPVILDGYGPIPIKDVKELAATAKFWRRFLTDPDTDRIISIGRRARKPPKAMAYEARLRDPVCTGIGCDRPARSCELDHTTPFNRYSYSSAGTLLPLGETSLENLRPRCSYCHHVKDDPHTGWTVENISPGLTRTITPTGRVYLQTQGDVEAPF